MPRVARAVFYCALVFGLFWRVVPVLDQPEPVVRHAVLLTMTMAALLSLAALWLVNQLGQGGARAGT